MSKQFSDSLKKIPQEYKTSILVVFVITLIGLTLNYFIGPIVFNNYQNPINISVLCFLFVSLIVFSFFRKSKIYKWFTGVPLTIVLLGTLLIYGLIIGLIPQIANTDSKDGELNTFFNFLQVKNSWSFALLYILILLSLGALIIRRLICFKKNDYAFCLNHVGIWLILISLALESTDNRFYMMPIMIGDTEWRVYEKDSILIELPVAINIKDIQLQWNENDEAKNDSLDNTKRNNIVETITVNTTVYTKDGEEINADIEINKPLLINNWFIYLHNYNINSNNSPAYCIMMLVYNPWYIFLYFGIIFTILGALCILGKASSNKQIKL